MTPAPAFAAPHTPKAQPKFTVVDKFERVAGDQTTGKIKDRVRMHVSDAMRRSQLVADGDLDTFTANVAGRKLTAVVPKGVKLKSAIVVTQEGVAEVGLGAEFENAEDSTAAPQPAARSEWVTTRKFVLRSPTGPT